MTPRPAATIQAAKLTTQLSRGDLITIDGLGAGSSAAAGSDVPGVSAHHPSCRRSSGLNGRRRRRLTITAASSRPAEM